MSARIGLICVHLCVLAAAVLPSAGCASSADRKQSAGPGTATYAGLVLRPPTTWDSVGVDFNTAALDQPLGYLTNQPPVSECRPDSTGHTSCGPPAARLGRAGVLVIVSHGPRPAAFFKPTSTVAGLPAAIDRSRCKSCPFGARYQIRAVVQMPSPDRRVITTVEIVGYFGRGDSRSQRDAFDRMLATATHH